MSLMMPIDNSLSATRLVLLRVCPLASPAEKCGYGAWSHQVDKDSTYRIIKGGHIIADLHLAQNMNLGMLPSYSHCTR
jgi:hypothetical protein